MKCKFSEIHHLIDLGHVERRVDPAFVAGGATPVAGGSSTAGFIFLITARGREYLEGKGGRDKQGSGQPRSASLKRIPVDLGRADSLLETAGRASSYAESIATSDHARAVGQGQEAVELAAKAIFHMAGFDLGAAWLKKRKPTRSPKMGSPRKWPQRNRLPKKVSLRKPRKPNKGASIRARARDPQQ